MRVDYDNGRNLLGQAVSALEGEGVPDLTADAPIRLRLSHAYLYGLHVIQPEWHLPPEVRDQFERIKQDFTWLPAEGEQGSVTRSLLGTTDEGCEALADRIAALYARVSEITGGPGARPGDLA